MQVPLNDDHYRKLIQLFVDGKRKIGVEADKILKMTHLTDQQDDHDELSTSPTVLTFRSNVNFFMENSLLPDVEKYLKDTDFFI